MPAEMSDRSGPAGAPAELDETLERSPFDVGTRAQLFVDRVLVRETERISFNLHPGEKHPANPLLRAEHPWEGWRIDISGNVLWDEEEKIFKMWYNGDTAAYFEADRTVSPALYAASADGIRWEKPLVGTVPSRRADRHNAVALVDEPSVIKDPRDPDPARRYKMICWCFAPRRDQGYRTMVSRDGFNWRLSSPEPISPGADVITGYYDETRRVYVAFPKTETSFRGHLRRVFSLVVSPDFRNWSAPELVWTPDLLDDAGSLRRIEEVRPMLDVPDDPGWMRTEFYGLGFYPAESCTLAFPWVFTINGKGRFGNDEGPAEIQLGASRDLRRWERPFRAPVVPRGRTGDWDSGFFFTQSRALRVGDEIRLYYSAGNFTHGAPCVYRAENTGRGTKYTSSIGLVRWPLDRFVSADGPGEEGTLVTVPIVFSGDRLEINARTEPSGSIAVEVLDAARHRIEGYGTSHAIRGDSLRHRVAWPGDRSIGRLRGAPICLRFRLRRAQLFSFAFRTGA